MSKKKVTFDDIAKYTNFSKTTISRYFNNPDSLTIKNQEIIAQALVDLDYQENKLAKVLANGRSEFIGIIIPNLYLHYYAEVLNRILNTYETFGYKFLVFVGTDHEETERKYIQELLAYKIEGMIILSHTIPSQELASYQIPIVTIERENEYVNSVNTDNYMGAVQATSLLAKNGCDILLHINSPVPEEIPSYGRILGFQDICKEQNINHELILRDLGNSYHETVGQMQQIFQYIRDKYKNRKKGLFMANDTHANIQENLYELNLSMLKTVMAVFWNVLASETESRSYTHILRHPGEPLSLRILGNMDVYADAILHESDSRLSDSEEAVIDFLNRESLSETYKEEYIQRSDTVLPDINTIASRTLWPELIGS